MNKMKQHFTGKARQHLYKMLLKKTFISNAIILKKIDIFQNFCIKIEN